MELPKTYFSNWIDVRLLAIGNVASWLWLALMLIIVLNVFMRYFLSMGRIEFEEVQWHLYAVGFLISLSVAYVGDDHVRVDVLRSRLPFHIVVWVELYGTLLLLLPFLLLIIIYAFPFVAYSYTSSEVSEAPAGLPYRWVIKSFSLIGFVLLFMASLSRLSRIWCYLFKWPSAITKPAVSKPTLPSPAIQDQA